MREALRRPGLRPTAPPLGDIQLVASNAPNLARAFLDPAPRPSPDPGAPRPAERGARPRGRRARARCPGRRCATSSTIATTTSTPIDRAAEHFAARLAPGDAPRRARRPGWRRATASRSRSRRTAPLRRYDPAARRLDARRRSRAATQAFQIAAPDRAARARRPARGDARPRPLPHRGRAGDLQDRARQLFRRRRPAALRPLPRPRRRRCATISRRSPLDFDASIEQVAQRLSTLQRIGAKGVPFFFVRVDQAGTITKRHSATRLQFARFGGACPLWNVHHAFETPGPLPAPARRDPGRRALPLPRPRRLQAGRQLPRAGAALRHRPRLRDRPRRGSSSMPTISTSATTPPTQPIGISCRICERRDCHQRAVPPLERAVTVDPERARPPALRDRLGRRCCQARPSRSRRSARHCQRRAQPPQWTGTESGGNRMTELDPEIEEALRRPPEAAPRRMGGSARIESWRPIFDVIAGAVMFVLAFIGIAASDVSHRARRSTGRCSPSSSA